MSLPGLELTAPTIEAQNIPIAPTQVSLPKGSEWRFEIAFGNTVRVKVCSTVVVGARLSPRALVFLPSASQMFLKVEIQKFLVTVADHFRFSGPLNSCLPALQSCLAPSLLPLKLIPSPEPKPRYTPGMGARWR